MFHILRADDRVKGCIAAVEFEGRPYGAGVSFFISDLAPTKGPGLHKHPYPETCIVQSGQVEVTVDEQKVLARAGDIVVIEAETPHCFIAIGEEQLQMICIHASDLFAMDWLDG